MKLFYKKHKSLELRYYTKKSVKELATKKVSIYSLGCLNSYKLAPEVVSYPDGYYYKKSSKEDDDFFIEELLIKKKRLRKT